MEIGKSILFNSLLQSFLRLSTSIFVYPLDQNLWANEIIAPGFFNENFMKILSLLRGFQKRNSRKLE